MTTKPISIALPVYNGERYIEASIRSLLDQLEACEIIVSDDCSTDGTREIVRGIKSDRIVLLENTERGGQFRNFNRAIHATSGRYVQFFSHDDIAHPGFVASQIASLHQDPAIGLTYASCSIIDEQGRMRGRCDDDGTPLIIDFNTYLGISSLHGSLPPSVSCVMIKREVIETVGLFDERFSVAGDLEFYNRVAERFRMARNRSMRLDVRVHGGSVTSSNSAPLKYMCEELDILPFYKRHMGDASYARMMQRRAQGRGATHAKYMVRSLLGGRFKEGAAAYRALAKVHNVPLCIFHALRQAAGARFLP